MRKHILTIALLLTLATINLARQDGGGHMEFYGLSDGQYKLWAEAIKNREPQPVPTYHVMVRAEDQKPLRVSVEGSYVKPDGRVVDIESHEVDLPLDFFVNADCTTRLTISTDDAGRGFTAVSLYEFKEISEWISTRTGIKSAQVALHFPAK